MPTPPLRTERLDLEPLRVGHADEMVHVLADRELYAFYDDEPSPTLDELRSRYERQSTGGPPGGGEDWHNWILRERSSGEAVGFVQATVRGEVADLAWVVGTAYQGRGYATEAARAARDALAAAGAQIAQAHIAPGNEPSEAVAQHLGLELTDEVDPDGERLWRLPLA